MRFDKASYRGLVPIFLSFMSSTASFAEGQPVNNFFFDYTKGHLVLELGGFYASQGKAQDIRVQNLVGNRYTVKSHFQGSGLAGVGYFLDGPQLDRFNFSYGANVFFLGTTTTKGYIIEEHLDTNLSYTYKIQNIPLFFMAKSIVPIHSEKVNLALDVGIGPNFIETSHYKEVPLTLFTLPNNGFSDRNSTAFAATVGAGLQFNNVADKIPLECGYRFFYLGQGQLAKNNDLIINTLKTGNNYANAIICSVTI
ncbi:hypothetical protein [Legionella tucsonensis]|uniref:Outer membrane protein beta-barrel domain-containing protein n=1 Tax=Legionella tucsonensis TaxID=40335 RepID=A0A0W0ZWY2_9GAMM|nr:hypothetical protein [Legionella tucsonensis]KTD73663.1 hypothetical protein Ltuc_1510 [Legionella tucsonensis]